MALDFPTSPATGTQATVAGRTWTWNGYAWDSAGSLLTSLTINEQTASYTLALTDKNDTLVRLNVATANNLTVPPNSSVAFPVGTVIWVDQKGAGATTIVAGSGVTLNYPAACTLVLASQYAAVTLVKTATDTWTVGGGLSVTPGRAIVQFAVSDETTALTTGTSKITLRMPKAITLSAVRASLTTAQTSGSLLTINVKVGGSTIFSTKPTFDNTEKTTTTAATASVLSTTSIADDAEVTVDIDVVGDGTAKGLKVTLIGDWT